MKTLENELAELRAEVAQLKREALRKSARESAPLSVRRGWFLGRTTGTLSQGGTVSVDVDIYSATDAEWQLTDVTIENCRDYFLNAGESIDSGTKVKVEWYETTWVVTQAYCDTTDTAPEE